MVRFSVLDVGVNAINMGETIRTLEEWIKNRDQNYVCVTTVHLVMEAQKDAELREILNSSGLTTPDGMPLVWVGKMRGNPNMDRVYGPDVMVNFSKLSAKKGYRNFYFGGTPEAVQDLAEKLTERFPGLEVVGTYSPPFRALTPEEDQEIVDMINEADPDVVWVGLGAPKQDKWMAEHMGRINAPVMIGVGAAFDFLSGRKKQAPAWIQKIGMEWFFRLISEPRRLWKRYLVTNTAFILLVVLELAKSLVFSKRRR